MSPPQHFLAILSAAAVMVASSCAADPGDALADRIVLTGSPPYTGNTYNMTVEPGEINEAALPAHPQDKSVWYEWTAPASGSGAANFTLKYLGGTLGGNLHRGLAAYTIAPGEGPVTMARLQPAGALVRPEDVLNQDYSLRLWTTPGQKFILRVWNGLGWSATHTLSFTFTARASRSVGDTPLDPQVLPPGNSTPIFNTSLSPRSDLTSETSENLLDGQWLPAGCVQWLKWTPQHTRESRIFLTDTLSAVARVAVVERTPAGQLHLLSTPGKSTVFSTVAGEPILLRVESPYYPTESLDLYIVPAQGGDEPIAPATLLPGKSTTIKFQNASPTRLPVAGDNPQWLPDFWFDLGSNLSGGFKIEFPWVSQATENDQIPDAEITIYRTDSAGNILAPVSGGKDTPDNAFLAQPGQRYMARVLQRTSNGASLPLTLRFIPLGTAAPYDRRETSPPLPPDGPIHFIADATNATAEESDWTPQTWYTIPRRRTLWFALDRPASPDPWYVSTVGGAYFVSIFRESDGQLINAEDDFKHGTYTLTGDRIWFRVTVSSAPRFILLAGPAVSPGDKFDSPIPITPGPAQPYYMGAATPDTAPAPAVGNLPSIWFSWTAAETGLVCFSTLGTPITNFPKVFTAAGEPVTSGNWNEPQEFGGYVTSFQAVAGTSYRIAVYDYNFGSIMASIQPGGWNSPWDVWIQHFPAWAGEPTLSDPLADTDRDGIANILEMACATNGPVIPDPSPQPWFHLWDGGAVESGFHIYQWVRPAALKGPQGCVPFRLTGEISTDLHTWTPVSPIEPGNNYFAPLSYLAVVRAGTPASPARFFRLRVYR